MLDNKVNAILNDFSESTTIHGILYFHKSKLPQKFAWLFVILSMLCCTVWFCYMSVSRYLQYDIKTTITYDTQPRLDWPAVTLCNQFPVIRSLVGSNRDILMESVLLLTEKLTDVPNVFIQSTETCKSAKTPYDNITGEVLFQMGIAKVEELVAQDAFRSVKKCWWAGNEFDCKGSFANHIIDRGYCFTFIVAKSISHVIQHSEFSPLYYGSNESVITDRYIVNSGPKSGLRLLMNVNQNEHCDASRKYEGAGFQAAIHEPDNSSPLLSMISAINLLPGFEINVALKQTVFKRYTAFLGLCNTTAYWFKEEKGFYFKNICAYFCYHRRIISVCGCVPRVSIRGLEDIINSLYGMFVNGIRDCLVEDAICMKKQQYETYLSTNLKDNCPECLQPCFETVYDFLVTMKRFPSNSIHDFAHAEFNTTNLTEIRKNFVLVNFFFDSLSVITVVESQSFTYRDLFIYIGGVIGLFLGMSFISIGDIFEVLSLCFFEKVRNPTKYLLPKMKVIFGLIGKPQLSKSNVLFIKKTQNTADFEIQNTEDFKTEINYSTQPVVEIL